MKKLLRLITILLLFAGVVTYMCYVVLVMPKKHDDEVCKGILLQIEDNPRADFINRHNIKALLATQNLDPVGKPLQDINLSKIEKFINSQSNIDSVECYKTVAGKVAIKIRQKTPILFIMPDSLSGYYIDENGDVFPNTNYTYNLPVVTGHITREVTRDSLVEFGKFLCENTFWDNQISQIIVTEKVEKSVPVTLLELIPRTGDYVISLGSIDDYRVKLRRLQVFYDKVLPYIDMEQYSKVNLKYPGQVICTRKDK